MNEYKRDFYAWTINNSKLLRDHKFKELDIENIAEELESMGKSEKREIMNRLSILIAHILKWEKQRVKRSRSWLLTIKEQRIKLKRLIDESPSLKNEMELKLSVAYEDAVIIFEQQTGIEILDFIDECPFSLDYVLNQDFSS